MYDLLNEQNVQVFYSHQCTCEVLAEKSVYSMDYYITKVFE